MATEIYTGSCLCQGIRFTLTGPPMKVFACYCDHCSKNAGGACQISAMYTSQNLAIEDSKGLQQVYTIESGTTTGFPKEKYFCRSCGCTLWTMPLKLERKLIVVRTSLVDGWLDKFVPTMEYFIPKRPGYMKPIDDSEGYEKLPGA